MTRFFGILGILLISISMNTAGQSTDASAPQPTVSPVRLLPGYQVRLTRGFDSGGATIWKEGGPKIDLFMGPHVALETYTIDKRQVVWREEQTVKDEEVICVYTKSHELIVNFPHWLANFRSHIHNERELAEVLLIALTLEPTHGYPVESLRTFTSPDGSFQFSYPNSYALHTGDIDGEGTVCEPFPAIACVVFPESRYAGTNFAGASFEERQIDEATTKSRCLAFPKSYVAAKDPMSIIKGISFVHEFGVDAAAGTTASRDAYRAFHKGKCYELSLNLATTQFSNFDPGIIKEFIDEDRVRNELTTILDSFTFLK